MRFPLGFGQICFWLSGMCFRQTDAQRTGFPWTKLSLHGIMRAETDVHSAPDTAQRFFSAGWDPERRRKEEPVFKKVSLRIRYLVSYLLVLITMAAFLSVLYYIYMDNNQRYINSVTLEKFTYASGNIAALIDKMNLSAAGAASSENASLADSAEQDAILESRIAVMLKNIEDSLSYTPPHVYFYLRGDRFIYSSEGKRLYADFEKAYKNQYNLTMSLLFTQLLSRREQRLQPILDDGGVPRAVAYVTPFASGGGLPDGQLIFFLSEQTIAEEFSHYMGDLPGDLYMYTSRYELLFRHTKKQEEMIPFSLLIRQRGVGVQPYGGDKVLLSVSDTQKGLNFVIVSEKADFYREMYRSGRVILALALVLAALLSALFWWITLGSYKPIRRLTEDITGQELKDMGSNELNLIRSFYNRTVEETEQLNSQLTELTPLVTRHLALRMAHGQIRDQQVFEALTRYARLNLKGNCFAAMRLQLFGAGEKTGPEELSRLLERLSLPGVTLMQAELPDENALCLIVNYIGSDEEKDNAALDIANRLLSTLTQSGAPSFRVGVGGAYSDPLRMADSYNEASAAIQLAPADSRARVFPYASGQGDAFGTDSLHQLPPMPCSLLVSAVRRGENEVAVRALKELMASISDTTESMLYFRFYAVSLSSLLLKAAEEENVSLSAQATHSLVSFSSRQEFEQSVTAFTDALCDEIRARRDQRDREDKEKLMSYILNHYMDFDLSVQSAAEAVDIRKSQVSAIVREDVGLNFVQYVSYLRMNEFKRLLVESDQSITECVTAIGYQDAPNFLRKFKVMEGITAGQYRAAHRGG